MSQQRCDLELEWQCTAIAEHSLSACAVADELDCRGVTMNYPNTARGGFAHITGQCHENVNVNVDGLDRMFAA